MRAKAIIRDKQVLNEIRKNKMETSTEIAELSLQWRYQIERMTWKIKQMWKIA